MTGRQALNKVFSGIQEPAVTDEELVGVVVGDDPLPTQKYEACITIITARAGEGNSLERLKAYALAVDNWNLDITKGLEAVNVATSNIFIGAACED